jgi:amidase
MAPDKVSLDRRDFLKAAAAGAAATFAAAPAAAAPAAAGSAPAPSPVPSFELDELTVADLQRAMAEGSSSSSRLTELYLRRIEETNRSGPQLRAVIETNPEAPAIAAALDRERREKGVRGPLHGIPVLLKDNIDTHDAMTTTAGSLALEGSRPPRDSFVAERLRAAGAVLLGKANLSEWANIRSNRSTSGWSARGGQCRNPYVLDRNPCGSSSGSGSAVAANLCALAVGTETDGSIICPSGMNGIVGMKPTIGLVSRAGIIPIAHSQDTAGPMTRTVRDAALLLGALAGYDPRDPATAAGRQHALADYTRFLDKDGLRGARIGVARKRLWGYSPAADAAAAEALELMKKAGAEIVDPADLPTSDDFDRDELEVLLYELKADLNAYLESLGKAAPVKSLAEVIHFNEKNKDREMPFFGQELFLAAQEKGPVTEQKYLDALAHGKKRAGAEGIDAVMDQHKLDALVAPSVSPAYPIDWVNGDHFLGASSSPAAVAGFPNITVPCGFNFGLPLGISFFGRAFSEPVLLRLAYAFEQASQARRPPQFRPTVTA